MYYRLSLTPSPLSQSTSPHLPVFLCILSLSGTLSTPLPLSPSVQCIHVQGAHSSSIIHSLIRSSSVLHQPLCLKDASRSIPQIHTLFIMWFRYDSFRRFTASTFAYVDIPLLFYIISQYFCSMPNRSSESYYCTTVHSISTASIFVCIGNQYRLIMTKIRAKNW